MTRDWFISQTKAATVVIDECIREWHFQHMQKNFVESVGCF